MNPRRELVREAYEQHLTVTQISRSLGIPRSAVYYWLEQLRESGEITVDVEKQHPLA